MMLQLGDDGVLREADEENLISVDEKELDELIDKANELLEENKQLKQSNQEAIEFILEGIVEMYDGKRYDAKTIFNKAIKLLKGDYE